MYAFTYSHQGKHRCMAKQNEKSKLIIFYQVKISWPAIIDIDGVVSNVL